MENKNMAENKKEIEKVLSAYNVLALDLEEATNKIIKLKNKALSTQKQEFEREKQIKISAMEDFCNKDELIFLQGLFGSKDLRKEIENRIGKISSKIRLREELKQRLEKHDRK